jgi:GntR family transcriptional repressor for pyruvate dehydrogenase complex
MKFHQTIAAASNNRILTSLMNMVATILFDSRSKTVKRARDLKQSAEQHHNIYRAMREHDPDAASRAMYDHLIETQKAQRLEELENAAAINGSQT